MKTWKWTRQRERAAALVAQDELTDEQIAETVGISKRALADWKQRPEFRARIDEHCATMREEMLRFGIARREKRLAALQDRWKRMQQVIAERAEDPQMARVPGGTSGLIAHDVKGVGRGEDFQLIDIYQVDTGLLGEMRAAEQQAAKELGQWTEKREHTGPDGGPIEVTHVLTDAERANRIAELLDTARARRDGQPLNNAGEDGTASPDAG